MVLVPEVNMKRFPALSWLSVLMCRMAVSIQGVDPKRIPGLLWLSVLTCGSAVLSR